MTISTLTSSDSAKKNIYFTFKTQYFIYFIYMKYYFCILTKSKNMAAPA